MGADLGVEIPYAPLDNGRTGSAPDQSDTKDPRDGLLLLSVESSGELQECTDGTDVGVGGYDKTADCADQSVPEAVSH